MSENTNNNGHGCEADGSVCEPMRESPPLSAPRSGQASDLDPAADQAVTFAPATEADKRGDQQAASAVLAPAIPNAPARDLATGRFLPGNFAASTHALRTAGDRLPPEFAQLVVELEEFERASIVDDGGAETLSRRRRSLHGYRARIHRRIIQLDGAIETRGLFDKRGKLRVAWLQQLQSLMRAAQGIDSLLGLERRPKTVPSLESYLRSREAQQDERGDTSHDDRPAHGAADEDGQS